MPRVKAPQEPPAPVPPGPIALELRVNDKIAFLQRCHSYVIDQQDDSVTIIAVLKLPVVKPEPVEAPEVDAVQPSREDLA